MEFYQQAGPMALGSRLRRISELVTENAGRINAFYQLPLEPKWFPVFFLLGLNDELSVTQIARQIGHSHPSVSQMVKEIKKTGLIKTARSKTDGRMHLISLTGEGRQVWGRLKRTSEDVGEAVETLLAETIHNLWAAMDEFEHLLSEKDLYSRVVDVYRDRESKLVEMIDYQPAYLPDIVRLQQEAASTNVRVWPMESSTEEMVNQAGLVKLAGINGEIVACCLFLARDEERLELAQLVVSEAAKGKGIRRRLLETAIRSARKMGIKRVWAASDAKDQSLIDLYRQLGFTKHSDLLAGRQGRPVRFELQLD